MDISAATCPGCKKKMRISKVSCTECDIALDGEFEVSELGRLSLEDQLFVTAFMRSHGSIKQMEKLFGISYPTVKNRLGSIVALLDKTFEAPTTNSEILERLAKGELNVNDALDQLQ
jgi:hypothetical protein